MKKIIILFFVTVALSLSFGSCSKDAIQTGILSNDRKQEIAAEDPEKVYSADMAGMYTHVQQYVYSNLSHNYFGQKGFDFLTSLMGNDMVLPGAFAMSFYHYALDYRGQAYTPTYNRWYEYYTMIDYCNTMLKSISADETNPTSRLFRAQALGLRGYAYYQLTLLYQYCYYVGVSDNKWGGGTSYADAPCVPIVTDSITGHQPRSTVAQVHDQIIKDLKGCYDL